jgi:hypothetical protein
MKFWLLGSVNSILYLDAMNTILQIEDILLFQLDGINGQRTYHS